jgi:hypothetical protein
MSWSLGCRVALLRRSCLGPHNHCSVSPVGVLSPACHRVGAVENYLHDLIRSKLRLVTGSR